MLYTINLYIQYNIYSLGNFERSPEASVDQRPSVHTAAAQRLVEELRLATDQETVQQRNREIKEKARAAVLFYSSLRLFNPEMALESCF